MESINEIANEVHAKPRFDVFLKRPEPMLLPLPGRSQRLKPKPIRQPMAQSLDDKPNRRLMPQPIPYGPYRMYASADGASPSSKP